MTHIRNSNAPSTRSQEDFSTRRFARTVPSFISWKCLIGVQDVVSYTSWFIWGSVYVCVYVCMWVCVCVYACVRLRVRMRFHVLMTNKEKLRKTKQKMKKEKKFEAGERGWTETHVLSRARRWMRCCDTFSTSNFLLLLLFFLSFFFVFLFFCFFFFFYIFRH